MTALSRTIVVGVVAFRLINALSLATQFDPDQFYQNDEVAHRLAFGYGLQTWEWRARLRSYTPTLPLALLFKLLGLLGADTPELVAHAPRLLHALVAAASDLALWRAAALYFASEAAGRLALCCSLTSWFMWYCAVRSYTNCSEAALTTALTLALLRSRTSASASIASALLALAMLVRPTSLPLSAALVLALAPRPLRLLPWRPALATAVAGVLVDVALGGATSPMAFARFNLLSGGASYFGTHPWHWYASAAIPALLGTHLPLVMYGALCSGRSVLPLLAPPMLYLLLHSLAAHKELRFALPTMTFFFACAGRGLATLSPRARVAALVALALTNAPVAWFLGRVHQRAPLAVMERLRVEASAGRISALDLLTRCAETPAYAQLHTAVPIDALECPPPALTTPAKAIELRRTYPEAAEECANECDCFFSAPLSALRRRYRGFHRRGALPSHVVLSAELQDSEAGKLLRRWGFRLCGSFAHRFDLATWRWSELRLLCRLKKAATLV